MPHDNDDSGKVPVQLARLRWRLDALDDWRSREVAPTLYGLRKDIDGMISAAEIAAAVAEKGRQDWQAFWSWPRKIAAFAAATVMMAGSIVGIVDAAKGLH